MFFTRDLGKMSCIQELVQVYPNYIVGSIKKKKKKVTLRNPCFLQNFWTIVATVSLLRYHNIKHSVSGTKSCCYFHRILGSA